MTVGGKMGIEQVVTPMFMYSFGIFISTFLPTSRSMDLYGARIDM